MLNIDKINESENLDLPIEQSEDLSFSNNLETNEKVSEIVRDNNQVISTISEKNIYTKKDSGIKTKVPKILSKKLPPIKFQKKQIKDIINQKTQKLIKKAQKIQNNKNFSASKLENIIYEIRKLRGILANLITATAQHIEFLYNKFVKN